MELTKREHEVLRMIVEVFPKTELWYEGRWRELTLK